MKPVHSYQLPASTYSIVPPYQFARYNCTALSVCQIHNLQIVSHHNPKCRYHTLGKRATAEEETAEFLNDWVDFKVATYFKADL